MLKVDKATVGKVVLSLVGMACTIGSALVTDAKQKATITDEAKKAVAEALANQVKES